MRKLFFFLQVVLPHVSATGWSVTIPRQIRTSSNDCVVIPCSYTLPASERSKTKEIMWYQEETQKLIFHSQHKGKNFKASLVDDFKVGNCSLWIRDITIADSMNYRFLIEIPGVRNYSSPSVDLRVSGVLASPELKVSPENVAEGDTMIMTCMTNHSCNMRPPSFVWNHILGEISAKTVDLENGIWQFVSTQIITASVNHHGLTIYCQTKYTRIKTSPSSRNFVMNVLYSPKNTTVTANAREIREGDNVSLRCSSQSNPEVSRYIWNGLTDDGTLIPLTGNQITIQISNIKSNMRSVYCTVQNAVGIQTSPVMELNITHKPQITPQSYCQPTFIVMECLCIVKANPPPFVIWHLMNSNITETQEGYDISTSVSDYVTKSLLRGPASAMTSVSCSAENTEGADELLLPVYSDITKYLVVAGAVGIAALLLVGVTLKLLLGGRKNAEEKNKTKDCHFPNNPYDCQLYSFNENTECPVYGNTELNSLYGNTELNSLYGNTECSLYGNTECSLYGNTEFAIKDDKETQHSTIPHDFYAVYDCPNWEEEPVCFEEEPVYANT